MWPSAITVIFLTVILVRIDEARQSIRILKQILPLLLETKGQPFFAGKINYSQRVPRASPTARGKSKGELVIM